MFGLPNNIHARLSASVLSYSYDLNITVSISDIYHSLLSNRQTLTDLEKRLVAKLGTSVEMQQLINTVLETSYGYAITLPPVKLTPLSQYTDIPTDYPTIYPTYTSTLTPSSLSPSSLTPTTLTPSSQIPTSQTPSSQIPTSQSPSSQTPTTLTPSSQIPTSQSPTPTSLTPSSQSPTPSSQSPTPSSQSPTPSSQIPTYQIPTTLTPTSQSPFAPWTYVVSTTPYMKPTVAVFNTNAPTPSFRPLSDTNSGCSETASIAVVFVSGMVIGAMLLSVFTILRKYCRVHPENDN